MLVITGSHRIKALGYKYSLVSGIKSWSLLFFVVIFVLQSVQDLVHDGQLQVKHCRHMNIFLILTLLMWQEIRVKASLR